jgi:hypothetical protein
MVVSRDDVPCRQKIIPAPEISDCASCLAEQQASGSHVPGAEVQLEEALAPSGCNIGKIDSR